MKELQIRKEVMSDEFVKNHIEGLVDENRNPLNAVIHTFTGIDKGDPHDHPFSFISTILSGWYTERIYDNLTGVHYDVNRRTGDTFLVRPYHIHKIVDMCKGGCNTIILPQKKIQEPGFWKFEDGKAYRRAWNEKEFKLYK